MRTGCALGALVALAACADPGADPGADPEAAAAAELDRVAGAMAMPVADEAPLSDRDLVIKVIEEAGCVVIADNAEAVFAASGLPEADFRRIGAELVADGLADVSRVGIYRLETPACAI